jgi:hypothetical protein
MHSTTFMIVIGVLTAIAIIGTLVSAVALYRSTRRKPGTGREAPLVSPRPSPTNAKS